MPAGLRALETKTQGWVSGTTEVASLTSGMRMEKHKKQTYVIKFCSGLADRLSLRVGLMRDHGL